MAGSEVGLSSELPHRDRAVFMLEARAEEPTGGSQSVRSGDEAGNDRGAKGRRKVESVKIKTTEMKPATVARTGAIPPFPNPAGDTLPAEDWVARSVWTERMLKRLAQSQETTVRYSLWDKVWQGDNLDQAVLKVVLKGGAAGVDGQQTGQLAQDWVRQITQLREELRTGSYRPHPRSPSPAPVPIRVIREIRG